MNKFRKQELERRLNRQRGKVNYELPDPESAVYLGKAPRKGSYNYRLYFRPEDDITVPVGGVKLG